MHRSIVFYTRCTPSDAIKLNSNKVHKTKLACNRPQITKRFIYNDRAQISIKNTLPSAIIQNY